MFYMTFQKYWVNADLFQDLREHSIGETLYTLQK